MANRSGHRTPTEKSSKAAPPPRSSTAQVDTASPGKRSTRADSGVPLDRSDLKFNNDVGALMAVHTAILDAVSGSAPLDSVPVVAARARRFLCEQFWARHATEVVADVGGRRLLPRTVRKVLRDLVKTPTQLSSAELRELDGRGMMLFVYANAVTRADGSWMVWDGHRQTRSRVTRVEEPKKWRYPASRDLLFRLQDAAIACGMFRDELHRLVEKSAEDVPYQPPKVEADDSTWRQVLEQRWRRIVRNAYSVRSISSLDDYHIGRDRVSKAIDRLRAATASAGEELDAGEVSPLKRYTTRFSTAIDVLHDAMPNIGRYGYRLPPDLESISSRITEAIQAFGPYETELRALSYQPAPGKSIDDLEHDGGDADRESHQTIPVEDYRPSSWFKKGASKWLRKASGKDRVTKGVKKRIDNRTTVYCVEDVEKWRPDLLPDRP